MPRHAVETGADGELSGALGFENQVLLAVADGLRVLEPEQYRPRMRILRGDGLVPEVETQAIAGGPAVPLPG